MSLIFLLVKTVLLQFCFLLHLSAVLLLVLLQCQYHCHGDDVTKSLHKVVSLTLMLHQFLIVMKGMSIIFG